MINRIIDISVGLCVAAVILLLRYDHFFTCLLLALTLLAALQLML